MIKKIGHIAAAALIVLGVAYYLFFMTGMYVSTAKFAVRGGRTAVGGDIMSLLGGMGSSTSRDSYIVAEYIKSLDMLETVNDKLGLHAHYTSKKIDVLSRLKKDATLDEYLKFWRSVVQVSFDSTTGILSVEVKAYTPQMAHNIATEILSQSEALMNRMNDRVQSDTMRQATREMERAEARYAKARKALTTFRATNSELDPTASAENQFRIIAQLEGKISNLMVELQTHKQFMKTDSVQIRMLQGNLAELRQQLAFEKNKLTGNAGPETLGLMDEFESLRIENDFARNYYLSCLTAVETARVQSESKSVYLEAFQVPSTLDEAIYPNRPLSALLVVVVVGMGYALLLLVVAAVKEHIGV